MLDREWLAVGDGIAFGEWGGDPGYPAVVKNGRGASRTSSSSVVAEAVGDPREDIDDKVGLETRSDAPPAGI